MDAHQELFVDSVACRYGKQMVLSSVHVSCRPGEVVGLLGRNGSGKSTLLKVIFGTLPSYYKHCKVNGKFFVKGYRTGAIAYLPQRRLLSESTKVKTALKLLTNRYREELLKTDYVHAHLNSSMGDLSGGIWRMIEVLTILYSDAQYVLLDEPFSNIAPLHIDELTNHINRLKAEKGFIITDHYYDRILEISNRVVLLHDGCNYTIKSREDLDTYGYISLP